MNKIQIEQMSEEEQRQLFKTLLNKYGNLKLDEIKPESSSSSSSSSSFNISDEKSKSAKHACVPGGRIEDSFTNFDSVSIVDKIDVEVKNKRIRKDGSEYKQPEFKYKRLLADGLNSKLYEENLDGATQKSLGEKYNISTYMVAKLIRSERDKIREKQ
jgi:hypothetical protein